MAHPPLKNDEIDTDSDHLFLTFQASLTHHHDFHWVHITRRVNDKESVERCIEGIQQIEWDDRDNNLSTHQMAKILHARILEVADKFIPWKTIKFRSTDDPWIDPTIRKKVAQRHEVYKK